MTEVAATRTLYTLSGGRVHQLRVILPIPKQSVKIAGGLDWVCECTFESDSLPFQNPTPGYGVDSVQALTMALFSVGVALDSLSKTWSLAAETFADPAAIKPIRLGHFFPRTMDLDFGLPAAMSNEKLP